MYAFLFKNPNPHSTVVLLGETSVEVKVNISICLQTFNTS